MMANNEKPLREKKKRSLMSLISPVQFILGVLLAFCAGALFLLVFQEDPVAAYSALFKGAFGSKRYISETLLSTTPLIFSK